LCNHLVHFFFIKLWLLLYIKKQKQKQKQKKKAWHLLLHVDALDIDACPSTVKAKEYFSSSCS
jgi:hypothetical protein